MNNHFINNIKITTFKCFDHLEISGFKRVNLVSGKNNIGKTALLEAIYFNTRSSSSMIMGNCMMTSYLRRNYLDICESVTVLTAEERVIKFMERIDSYVRFSINTDKNEISFSKSDTLLIFKINNNEITLKKIDFIKLSQFKLKVDEDINSQHLRHSKKSNFVYPSKICSSELIHFYEAIQEENREKEINSYLHDFDPSLTNVKFFANGEIKLEKNHEYQRLNDFGDGLKSYLAIILAIYHCKDGYLFIDELENGIHYTQYDQLWEIILTASKNVNCQIFVTTHSKECIDAYARVARKAGEKEITYTTLVNSKFNNIMPIHYDYDLLQSSLEQDHEVRGW